MVSEIKIYQDNGWKWDINDPKQTVSSIAARDFVEIPEVDGASEGKRSEKEK